MSQVIEAVRQVRGEAGERQVAGCDTASTSRHRRRHERAGRRRAGAGETMRDRLPRPRPEPTPAAEPFWDGPRPRTSCASSTAPTAALGVLPPSPLLVLPLGRARMGDRSRRRVRCTPSPSPGRPTHRRSPTRSPNCSRSSSSRVGVRMTTTLWSTTSGVAAASACPSSVFRPRRGRHHPPAVPSRRLSPGRVSASRPS